MYTVEPSDHWRVGDRAYCLRGLKHAGKYVLERGRIYEVVAVLRMRGVASDGLHLEGVDRRGTDGFWSNRFVCLRGSDLPHRQITARTRHSWLDAYWATAAARSPAIAMARGSAETACPAPVPQDCQARAEGIAQFPDTSSVSSLTRGEG